MSLKRPPTESAAPAKKRSKDEQKKCHEVALGLQKVEGLPRDVAKMLADMLDVALPTFSDERHDLQERVVALGEDVLRGHEKVMETKIASTEEAIAISAQAAVPQQKAVDSAEVAVKEKTQAELTCKQALAEIAQVFQSAKKALDETEAARSALGEELVAAATKKELLKSMQTEMVAPLTEGGLEEERKTSLIDSLVKELVKLGIEGAMVTALPACFSKAPEERGSFDTMVVSQLKEELAKRVAAVVAELEQAEPTTVARTVAVDQATSALAAARARQVTKAQEFRDSQGAREGMQEDLDTKCQSLHELEREQKKHRKDLERVKTKLETFREGTLATYASLRTRTSPVPEPEVAAAEMEMVEDGEASTAPGTA